MNLKNTLAVSTALVTALVTFAPAEAQNQTRRQLDTFDLSNPEIVEINGVPRINAPLVGIFWDERCANVEYTFNSTIGANEPFAAFGIALTPEQLANAVQNGLDRWNANPASYIEMNVTSIRDLGARPRVGGDFINEVTFFTAPTFNALASSPSTSLSFDTEFIAGEDLNGDGNPDVFDPEVEGRNTCFDADGDGDIEFPAGFYKAGTILDNDVQFNTTVFWELEPSDLRFNIAFADVDAVSTHEFGHSHGHAHTPLNQISRDDGTGTTMFPFIDTADAESEFGSRSLHVDDLALSAFIYPEGSGDSGIAALQPGDIAFEDAYDVLRGEVLRENRGVVGAFVSATTKDTGERVSGILSGTPETFLSLDGQFFFAPEDRVRNGEYELPVPKGGTYLLDIEALDGDPVAANRISLLAITALILGDDAFPEEFQNTGREDFLERQPGKATPVPSQSSRNLDFKLNAEGVLPASDFPLAFIGTGAIGGAASIQYAQRVDKEVVLNALSAGLIPVSATYRTGTLDASRVPLFSNASLALGELNADGSQATLVDSLDESGEFVGQDGDLTPFFFRNGQSLANAIRRELQKNPDRELFLVLEAAETEAPGPSGFPPHFLALDEAADSRTPSFEPAGNAYFSRDGGPLLQRPGNWVTELRFTAD
ncbi:MAG: hypothetical protein V2I57_13540 [Xanthomonadales bacterium]|jgi:hypothetical protein|nr:hypothetical protein [Xanthomonadales bacterium]